METKRKYTDEPGADKGAIHLMINRWCGNSCPLCCNKQYDLDTVPVVTVEELKAAHTVMLTGGDPFYVESLMDNSHSCAMITITSNMSISTLQASRC
jgi:hypothetical protein